MSAGALTSVNGTPISLLKLLALGAVRKVVANTPASRSFTEVLPTEPVMPMTASGRRSRAAAPSRVNAAIVSSTRMAVAGSVGDGFLRRQVGRRRRHRAPPR